MPRVEGSINPTPWRRAGGLQHRARKTRRRHPEVGASLCQFSVFPPIGIFRRTRFPHSYWACKCIPQDRSGSAAKLRPFRQNPKKKRVHYIRGWSDFGFQ